MIPRILLVSLALAPLTSAAAGMHADDMVGTVDTFWELGAQNKRGTFVVRTYLPNYVLPAMYTSDINSRPHSPTHAEPTSWRPGRQVEAKFQISLRAKVAQSVLLPRADVWFAYTQQSLWQVWNRADSSPFRSTDYQPEAIWVIPTPDGWTALPEGWRWQASELGVAHQSNGQRDPLSRSWNRAYLGAILSRGGLSLQWRLQHRFAEAIENDDNPDLLDYTGRSELSVNWLMHYTTAGLLWKSTLHDMSRGSWQLDFTHPVDEGRPDGLRWYLQLFDGYAESLLDYNHRQSRVGVGITLFQL